MQVAEGGRMYLSVGPYATIDADASRTGVAIRYDRCLVMFLSAVTLTVTVLF